MRGRGSLLKLANDDLSFFSPGVFGGANTWWAIGMGGLGALGVLCAGLIWAVHCGLRDGRAQAAKQRRLEVVAAVAADRASAESNPLGIGASQGIEGGASRPVELNLSDMFAASGGGRHARSDSMMSFEERMRADRDQLRNERQSRQDRGYNDDVQNNSSAGGSGPSIASSRSGGSSSAGGTGSRTASLRSTGTNGRSYSSRGENGSGSPVGSPGRSPGGRRRSRRGSVLL